MLLVWWFVEVLVVLVILVGLLWLNARFWLGLVVMF